MKIGNETVPNSIGHHVITTTIAFGVLSLLIYAELFMPGIQFYLSHNGEPNGDAFYVTWDVRKSTGALMLTFCVGYLAAQLSNVKIGWLVTACILISLLYGLWPKSVPVGWVVALDLGTATAHLTENIGFNLAGLIGILLLGFRIIRGEEKPTHTSSVIVFVIGLLALTMFLTIQLFDTSRAWFLMDTMMIEGARSVLVASFGWAILMQLLVDKVSVHWLNFGVFACTLVCALVACRMLGVMGMPQRYVDYPNIFAMWSGVLSICIVLQSILLIWVACRVALQKENK